MALQRVRSCTFNFVKSTFSLSCEKEVNILVRQLFNKCQHVCLYFSVYKLLKHFILKGSTHFFPREFHATDATQRQWPSPSFHYSLARLHHSVSTFQSNTTTLTSIKTTTMKKPVPTPTYLMKTKHVCSLEVTEIISCSLYPKMAAHTNFSS